jgi:hypothetical protein
MAGSGDGVTPETGGVVGKTKQGLKIEFPGFV